MNNRANAMICSLLLSVAVTGGCSTKSDPNDAYADAILEVYSQIDASYEQMKRDVETESETWWQMGLPGVRAAHFRRISRIDSSRCPPEFQVAFEEYLFASKDVTDTIESTQGWIAWGVNFATAGTATLIPAFLESSELAAKMRDAEFKMQRIAMRYGITFGEPQADN